MKSKLKAIAMGAVGAVAAAAAGTTAAAYALFKKSVDVGGAVNTAYKVKMGTDWEQYVPMLEEKIEWFTSAQPQTHYITTADKLKLKGFYLPSQKTSHKTVIAVHGYKSSGVQELSPLAHMYYNHGYNVLLIDNRAHGESEGKYAGMGILDRYDVLQWIRYILANIDPAAEIYMHGVSMGGATVLMVSELRLPENVKAIIADCAFTNTWDILSHVFKNKYHMSVKPLLALSDLICRRKAGYRFKEVSTLDALAKNELPVLFIHGSEDRFVPVEMSRQNYEACISDKKELVIVDGANHAECMLHSPELYEQAVFEFLNS